jgi:hypothetical protein
MRYLPFSMLLLFAVALSSCNSPKTTAQFYHTHKVHQGVTNFKLPGWLVWMGSGIAAPMVKNPEAKAALKLAKKTGTIRFLVSEEHSLVSNAEMNTFVTNIKRSGYEDLIQVREGKTVVNILARDKKDKLRNLLIMVKEEDSFVFMDMKTRIKYKDLAEMINSYLNMDKDDLKEEEEPPVEQKPKAQKPTQPRA